MESIVKLSETQKEQFKRYYQLLIEENQKYNLTAITKEEDVYIKHFYDSIVISKYFDFENKTLVDVGSGAGFPGIPLKIVHPTLHVTLVEPTLKRANFLKMVIKDLNLKDIEVIAERAENLKLREKYDYGTARAVAQTNILLELITPIVKVNGEIILFKGSNYQEEIKTIDSIEKALDIKLNKIIDEELPKDNGKRYILCFSKLKKTSSLYPRHYSKIKSKPL